MLRMLQNVLSEKIFWRGVHTYIINNDLDYKNLMKSLNKSMDDTHFSTINVHKSELLNMIHIIDPWTKQKHYPTIIVKRDYDHPYSKMVLIEDYNPSHHYCIPLTYTVQRDLNFNDTVPRYWLNKTEPHLIDIKFKEDGWVIFNIQQIGYYRVNYDFGNWKKIARYLASTNYTKIHVLNRAQIIDDAFHFMITKQHNSYIFWNIAQYLQQETDYVAWYPMFKALEYMSSIFSIDTVNTKPYFIRIRNTLYEMLKNINYTELPNEDEHKKCLRQEAAKWACLLRRRECLEEAKNKLMQHFADPEKHKLLPWWTEWTYRNGLSTCEADSIWQDLYNIWVNNTDNKISKFLSCTQNVDIIKNYLSKTANVIKESSPEDYILRSQAINNFLTTITKHVRIEYIHSYILSNFEKIIPRQISIFATLTVIINHLYDDEQLTKLENFLKNDLRRRKLHFEFNTEISSQKNKKHEANANLLKIQDKIKNRRSQIEDLHKFSQIFKY